MLYTKIYITIIIIIMLKFINGKEKIH